MQNCVSKLTETVVKQSIDFCSRDGFFALMFVKGMFFFSSFYFLLPFAIYTNSILFFLLFCVCVCIFVYLSRNLGEGWYYVISMR